ncbi:MAG TPA: hypothetical protein VFM18_17135 [Methanosarcina sp.]|nr:hypothetical protein [Methanosarcina sp.]
MSKLTIQNEMAQFDRKNRDFFDELDTEEQKKFAPFLMIRWGSSVGGSADMQAYYLMSCNERLNKHFFEISTTKHKKFQWLLATTVSPGIGNQYHQWIAPKKKESNSKVSKFLRSLYPHLNEDEISLMAELNSVADLKELAKEMGMEPAQIKKELG